MKQQIINFKILTLTSVLILVILSGCQMDDVITDHNSKEAPTNLYKKSYITFKQLQNNLKNKENFECFENVTQIFSPLNKGSERGGYITEIDSSKIVVFESEDIITYTLKVNTTDEEFIGFTNLLIAEHNDNISVYLFKYLPSQNWINSISTENKIPYEGIVSLLTFDGNLLATLEIIDGVSTMIEVESKSATTTCTFTAIPIWIDCYGSFCPCPDGNGAFGGYSYGISCSTTGGGGGGNGNNNGDGIGGGGGGSGSGSGNNGDLPTDPDEWESLMFDVTIFIEQAFKNNSKLYGVYTDMGRASAFDNYLQNFNDEFSVAHLRFGYDINYSSNYSSQYWNGAAITIPPQNYLINIVFNGDSSLPDSRIDNQPRLVIALAFMHELIHAEIFRKLMSIASLPHVNFENLTQSQWETLMINLMNDFPGIWDYYLRYDVGNSNPSQYQHQMMAQHYRSIIVSAISEYDNYQQPPHVYEALAWIGLKNTTAWNNLPTSQQTIINNIINDYYASNPY